MLQQCNVCFRTDLSKKVLYSTHACHTLSVCDICPNWSDRITVQSNFFYRISLISSQCVFSPCIRSGPRTVWVQCASALCQIWSVWWLCSNWWYGLVYLRPPDLSSGGQNTQCSGVKSTDITPVKVLSISTNKSRKVFTFKCTNISKLKIYIVFVKRLLVLKSLLNLWYFAEPLLSLI